MTILLAYEELAHTSPVCHDSNLYVSVFIYTLHKWDRQGIYLQIIKKKSFSRNTTHRQSFIQIE